MATKAVLTELSAALRHRSLSVDFESFGGLEVAGKIRAGVGGDLAVLGREQMTSLDAEGHFEPGTLRPLFVSDVVAANREQAPALTLSTAEDLRAALIGAGRVAYSTGPSGTGLVELIGRWGLAELLRAKMLRADPGTPVAALLTSGEADLGFQQRSELEHVAGVRVLGPLPGAAAIRSTFSGAVLARSTSKHQGRDVLDFMESSEAADIICAAEMSSARLCGSA